MVILKNVNVKIDPTFIAYILSHTYINSMTFALTNKKRGLCEIEIILSIPHSLSKFIRDI